MNKEKQTKANKYFKRFFWAVFLFYLLILIKIVLLKDSVPVGTFKSLF